MADINTAIPMPAQRVSSQLIRQDTFFDVTMSKKRHDRIVPVMAVHETVPPTQANQYEQDQSVVQDALGKACKAVLATPELLASILIFLPAEKIFGVTRVSRAFRDSVATSPAIQKELFFRPSGPSKEVWQVLGPQFSWYFAIRKRRYLKLRDTSECDPEAECLVTPVVLNPCVRIVSTRSNYKVKISLPKIHSLCECGARPRVADLLRVDGESIGISFMDTYISQPVCEKIDIRLHIALVDYSGATQAEFTIRQRLSGKDSLTPRSALKACWESSHRVRLWYRDEGKDGTELSCYWVENVKILELVNILEKEEKLTAVIGGGTTFTLCSAMVPSEAVRDAVEVETE